MSSVHQMEGQTEEVVQRLNLLLMGKTGSGKSFTGNNIIGRRAFVVSSKPTSVTREVQTEFATHGKKILKVVDGPGIRGTDMDSGADQEMAAANMAQALAMCDGGVDAFLFVCKYGVRFTAEEKAALDGLKNIFGEKYYSHLIVVLTMGDLFRNDMEDEGNGNITFLDWCRQQTGPFKQLFDDCGRRFVLFNNREEDENAKNRQIQEIIELVSQLQKINGRYTSHAFQAAKELRERYIIKNKLPILAEQIQEKCGLLSSGLEKYMQAPTEQGKLKIKESIAAVEKVIEDEDKGTNLLQPVRVLVERVKENLDNIDQLNQLTRELDDTRKSKIAWTAFGFFCAAGGGLFCAGGLSIAMTLLAITAPPVAVGVAIGIAATSAAVTASNYVRASKQEQKLKEEQDKTKSKLNKAGIGGKSTI